MSEPNSDQPAAAGHEAHHEVDPMAFLRERAISFGSMERPLRLITGLALAQVLVAAVLVAVRDHLQPRLSVYTTNNELLDMPLLIFWVSVAWLALSISYLLAGALHARWPIRFVGLAVFSLLMLVVATASISVLALLAMLLLIACAWIIGVIGLVRDHQHRQAVDDKSHHHRLFSSSAAGARVLVPGG